MILSGDLPILSTIIFPLSFTLPSLLFRSFAMGRYDGSVRWFNLTTRRSNDAMVQSDAGRSVQHVYLNIVNIRSSIHVLARSISFCMNVFYCLVWPLLSAPAAGPEQQRAAWPGRQWMCICMPAACATILGDQC